MVDYFEWLMTLIKSKKYSPELYSKLLSDLIDIDFVYYYPMDENRAIDGMDLRYRFMDDTNKPHYFLPDELHTQCSVLEMMIALAIRCEEDIMSDYSKGNRTGEWFWAMIESLGLNGCTDDVYNKNTQNYIHGTVARFLVRDFKINGEGGLFTIDQGNIRDKEIWYQMCDYLNYIIERRNR